MIIVRSLAKLKNGEQEHRRSRHQTSQNLSVKPSVSGLEIVHPRSGRVSRIFLILPMKPCIFALKIEHESSDSAPSHHSTTRRVQTTVSRKNHGLFYSRGQGSSRTLFEESLFLLWTLLSSRQAFPIFRKIIWNKPPVVVSNLRRLVVGTR
jgi:hypothetical protein